MPEIADPDIEPAIGDLFLQLPRRQHRQRQRDAFVALPETRYRLAQTRIGADRGMSDQSQMQLADKLMPHLARIQTKMIDCLQQSPASLHELHTLWRQAETTAAALAQAKSEPGFQRRQLGAD